MPNSTQKNMFNDTRNLKINKSAVFEVKLSLKWQIGVIFGTAFH
jgi:hypothetical protein